MTGSRFDLRGLRDRDELTAVGTRLAGEIKNDDVPTLAAAVSFKIVLALFPAMLAAVAIFAIVTNRPEELEALLDNLPGNVTAVFRDQLREFIDQAASGAVAVTGIVAGLWAASSAAATLNKALTRAYDETEGRKLVAARISALGVTVALLLALIGISVLLVAGGAIEDAVVTSPPLTETARQGLTVLSTVGRYVAAILLLMVLFAFIYWIGPDFERRPSWRWITPGAALAVVAWLLASAGFGWYVATFGSYTDADSPYGPLGSAIVFMLWLQLSMFALLLGAEVNQVLALRARGGGSGGDPGAGSIGTGDDGRPVAAAGGGNGVDGSKAPGGLRARTTPTGGRSGPVPSRPGGARADSAAAAAAVDAGAAPSRDTRDRRAAGQGSADRGSGGTQRSVPTATLVGAGIATLSSLVGLTGLLRRLKG